MPCADGFGGNAGDNGEVFDRFGNDRPSGDDGTSADGYSWQYNGTRADEDVIFDLDRSGGWTKVRGIDFVFGVKDHNFGGDIDVIADS